MLEAPELYYFEFTFDYFILRNTKSLVILHGTAKEWKEGREGRREGKRKQKKGRRAIAKRKLGACR